MLCGICKTREAKVFYTEISGGTKKNQYLCEQCAANATGLRMKLPFQEGELTIGGFLAGILDSVTKQEQSSDQEKQTEAASQIRPFHEEADVVCAGCGMSYREFCEKGRFGCRECYDSFQKYLGKRFRKIQGVPAHTDTEENSEEKSRKIPKLSESERLRLQLDFAVEQEDFVQAAMLRDKLKSLEMNGAHNG